MTSEEAVVGMRVMVSLDHRSAGLRGEVGTIEAGWGDPDYAALDVLMDDRTLLLFWHHELHHVGDGNGSASGSRNVI